MIMLNILAGTGDIGYVLYTIANYVCLVGSALLAIFITVVILIQPGNSNGISALGGNTDTFYNRGRGKTLESKLRRLTFICLAIMAVLMLAFFVISKVWAPVFD